MLLVGVCSNKIRDSSTFYLTKKNFTSLSLGREVFLEKDTVVELS